METLEIGKTAGLVWKELAKNGRLSITEIPKNIGVDPVLSTLAVGWLAREDKIRIRREAKKTDVWLTEHEIRTYKQVDETRPLASSPTSRSGQITR
jgi:hypothetical protein